MAHRRSRANRLVSPLRILLLFKGIGRFGQVRWTIFGADVFAHFLDRLRRNSSRVGTHVGIRPTSSSLPSSTPSYNRCAIIMVRFTLKRSLREESCCSLLVVKGGAA